MPPGTDLVNRTGHVRKVPTADMQSYGSAWLARGIDVSSCFSRIKSTERCRAMRYADLETDYDLQACSQAECGEPMVTDGKAHLSALIGSIYDAVLEETGAVDWCCRNGRARFVGGVGASIFRQDSVRKIGNSSTIALWN